MDHLESMLPELIDAMLSCAPHDIGLDVMQVVERFVIYTAV